MFRNKDLQDDRLIIFGRYPVPGQTKTRLIPDLGPAGAAELQRQLTEKVITTARAFTPSRGIDLNFHFGSSLMCSGKLKLNNFQISSKKG